MSNQPTAARKAGQITRIWLSLLTWEWQDWEIPLEVAIPMVPPGVALRKYEQIHNAAIERWSKENKGGKRKTNNRALTTKDEKIRSGARAILISALNNLIDVGLIESRPIDRPGKFPKEIRFKDRRKNACSVCGCRADGTKPESDA